MAFTVDRPESAYVIHGKTITDHLAPINATMFISTGVLLPVMDFVRPSFPYINYVAGAVALAFMVLLAMRLLGVPFRKQVPASLLLTTFVCACAFSVGAVASARHASQGGYIAATSGDAKALQSNLLNIERQSGEISAKLDQIQAGESSDPRVELRNIGIPWSESEFQLAARRGDTRVFELFLAGGMPIHSSYDGTSVAAQIVKEGSPNTAALFALLKKYGVDLNDRKTVDGKPTSATPPNLYYYAREVGASDAADALTKLGVETLGYDAWKKSKPVQKQTHWSGI